MNRLYRYFQKLPTTAKEVIKFALVGGFGTLTNLTIYTLLVTHSNLLKFELPSGFFVTSMSLELLLASTICFLIAASQNYFLNEKWTFNFNRSAKVNLFRYKKFLLFSFLSLLVNLAVLYLIFEMIENKFSAEVMATNNWLLIIPQAGGILAGMFLNFTLSKLITFKNV